MRRSLSFACVLCVCSPLAAQREFGFDNSRPSGQAYLKPEESVARMKVADGFEVKVFAAEPQLVNPIAMTVDEKGRVWVVECFEYPKRTAQGKMPRDRIKILEDTDGDGVCDKVTIFAEGKDFPVPFDLASGIEVGHGGVFLGAPPYLFFIENKNDRPGKIEVLLKGFGSQDTHETLNTFQWGPDGRLYGLHGVFTHSDVKPAQADGPATRLNAGVWRYDVRAKKFEVFAEGTSNPWGMDWRNTDGQFILCCCVIPHLYHIVPGGVYKRQAGQSFNPYAYGYINEICDHTFHKESGWAHAGLISLDTPLMPPEYRNSVIFGSIHGCSIKRNVLRPNGSSFIASRADDFLQSGDKNFRPINLRWGPNGEIYCIDWHDQNPCHQAAPDSWDYEHGRVYRIQPKGLETKKAEDLGKQTTASLIKRLEDDNPYVYRTAMRRLSEKAGLGDTLSQLGQVYLGPKALRAVWMLHARNELTGTMMGGGFRANPTDAEFAWVLRSAYDADYAKLLLPDEKGEIVRKVGGPLARLELAVVARRVAAARNTLGIVHGLMQSQEDAKDPLLPFMVWLAYEPQMVKARDAELHWLRENASGNSLITDHILPRAMRRLVATGDPKDLAACLGLLGESGDASVQRSALAGLAEALKDRQVDAPAHWKSVREGLARSVDPVVRNLVDRLAVSFRDPEAVRRSLAIASDAAASLADRVSAIHDVGLARPAEATPVLLRLVRAEPGNEIRSEAVRALAGFDRPEIAHELLAGWAAYPPPLKSEVVQLLAGRKEWARELLAAVGAKKIQRTELTDNTILRIGALKDKQLQDQVEKVWGRVRPTPAELSALIDKMRRQLDNGRASFARGKVVFDNQCAKCHRFDGRGAEVGPNIEGAGRDVEYLLVNILDPNRVIGAPYFMRTLNLADGSVVTGVLAAEDDHTVTLKSENAVLKVIPKKNIEESRVQEKSLMPEGLANNMSVGDFRDLIRYVMANPYLTDVRVTVRDRGGERQETPLVGPSGQIKLPEAAGEADCEVYTEVTAPAAMKTNLVVGCARDFEVRLNGSSAPGLPGKGAGARTAPTPVTIAVNLKKGVNKLALRFPYSGRGEIGFARFVDPDRKLFYHDWLQRSP